jgi:hypothetical protein
MKLKEELIKSVTLGLDKYPVKDYGELAAFAEKLSKENPDKEDEFLKMSALSLAYAEAGSSGIKVAIKKASEPASGGYDDGCCTN